MKKIFYLAVFLFAAITMFGQAPGGVSGSALWLKGNTGASATAWTDYSGLTNNFSATTGNEPVLNSNVFNFNAALGFNGINTYMTNATPNGFPTANNGRTIFV